MIAIVIVAGARIGITAAAVVIAGLFACGLIGRHLERTRR